MVPDGDSLGAEVDDAEASLVVDPLVLGASEPLVLLPVSVPALSDAPPVAPESPVESALLVWLALVLLPVSALADDSPAPASLPVSVPALSDAPPVAPESPVESALLVWLALVLSELPLSVDPSDEP